ncbi:zinc ABC transporter substrate-binding protein [Azomonas macrocytogenes]|uniref:High-affinity zinc uptake system protein ZnuA n=1 Tax=Azomonas macrocytogenes TaxID=69962 RepID=A0A839T097_AZOMA|nr:zinc ABC transporter substrate-binding protein [Azomonas macrocytogenes]MBB3102981.1 zinc transport system substrate-binding protein [Azomonas macrocytogenes]
MSRLFSVLLLFFLLSNKANAEGEVKLLTSIKPLQLIAAAVQDGVGKPAVLLPPGASGHHYSLRPSDIRSVREAQLFYWIGQDMETFLIDVVHDRQGPSISIQTLPDLQLRYFGQEHGVGHHDTEHDQDHRPGSLDAHLWLQPSNALLIAKRMAADLTIADPVNTERYQANSVAFEQRLEMLDKRLRKRLAGLSDKSYFVFHEAYDYFEATYGLKHAGVFNISGEVQPGARHIAELRERLQKAGPSCVFSEPPLRPRLVETLSANLPVTMAEIDPMGTGIEPHAQGYEELLERLTEQLSGCLEKL